MILYVFSLRIESKTKEIETPSKSHRRNKTEKKHFVHIKRRQLGMVLCDCLSVII